MPKIFAAAVLVLAILVGYNGATWRPQPAQSDVASKEKKVPKTGYSDPFIPPTKGNGF